VEKIKFSFATTVIIQNNLCTNIMHGQLMCDFCCRFFLCGICRFWKHAIDGKYGIECFGMGFDLIGI
jgi:hypothetical protein